MFKDAYEPTKISLAKRIAERERVVSQTKWPHNDCLPTAVAFTHGLPPDYHKIGLYARSFVYQAIEASSILAERNNETASVDKFIIENRDQTVNDIKRRLDRSDTAWIIFGNSEDSHVLGSLKLEEDEYMVVNLNLERPYAKMTTGEIADYLMEYKKYTDLGACIVGFKKK